MKSGKAIVIILVIVLVLVGVFLGLNYYFTRSGSQLSDDLKDQKHYKILSMTANKGSLEVEYYFILNNENKVIQTRIVEIGYTEDELNKAYNNSLALEAVNFDAKKDGNQLIYSTTLYNGKTADEIKTQYQNNSNYKNVIIKEK